MQPIAMPNASTATSSNSPLRPSTNVCPTSIKTPKASSHSTTATVGARLEMRREQGCGEVRKGDRVGQIAGQAGHRAGGIRRERRHGAKDQRDPEGRPCERDTNTGVRQAPDSPPNPHRASPRRSVVKSRPWGRRPDRSRRLANRIQTPPGTPRETAEDRRACRCSPSRQFPNGA